MKPLALALGSVVINAFSNVLIQRKLVTVSPLVNMLGMYASGLAVTMILFVVWRMRGGTVGTIPRDWYGSVVVLGIAGVMAGVFFFSSYAKGGTLLMVTTVTVLLPVCAALIDLAIAGNWLTMRHVIAWILVAIAVFLVMDR